MSRLGKKPVPVPANVKVSITGRKVSIASGTQTLEMEHRPEVRVAWKPDEKHLEVSIDPQDSENRQVRAYWGMTRAMLQNMVNGVTKGYEKSLEVVGVGFTAAVSGKTIDLKLGFANIIKVQIPPGLDVSVDKQFIKIKGADRQKVGQLAADIRAKRKPEPYNGKGVKYTDEVIRRKQGKAFGA